MPGVKYRVMRCPGREVLQKRFRMVVWLLIAATGIGLWGAENAFAEDSAAVVADSGADSAGHGGPDADTTKTMMLLLFTFLIAIFLGVELITKVPSQLHTPLMSGSNAISGITIVGAIIAAGHGGTSWLVTVVGILAMICAAINVAGGYLVTNRMLRMFKGKEGSKQ